MNISCLNVDPAKLKRMRELCGWSRQEASKRSGLSQPTLATIESKEKTARIQPNTLNKLAKLFGVTPRDLLDSNKSAELLITEAQQRALGQVPTLAPVPEPAPDSAAPASDSAAPVPVPTAAPDSEPALEPNSLLDSENAPDPATAARAPLSATQRTELLHQLREKALSLFTRQDFTEDNFHGLLDALNTLYAASHET